jgi:TolB-like protein
LAELVDPGDVASVETVTVNMTLTGTVPYMAPEQFGGVCDQRTDLWGAGAVLYEMATGQLPFPETQVQKLKDAILTKDPARPSTINPKISQGLETVILRALQKDPNRRYQTAAGLRDDLIRVATGRRTRDKQKEHVRQFAVAALAILLVASALAVYHFWPDIRDRFWPSPQEQISQFRLLAILPVESNGQNAPDDALVRGMAETFSAHIAQATQGQRLQLIPPRELIARDAKTSDAARREFGVERVLEVTVQRSGDQVRVTCSLIDPRKGSDPGIRACVASKSELRSGIRRFGRGLLVQVSVAPRQRFPRQGKEQLPEALVTSPKLPEEHICLGNLDNDTGKYEAAVSEFQLAASVRSEER